MRITQNVLFNHLQRSLLTTSSNLLSAQEQVATQKKINRLSDNTLDGGRLLDLKASVSRATQYINNIERMESVSDVQDSSLGEFVDLIARAKELLLKENNEVSSTIETREATRIELSIITDHMVQIANTQFEGQYLFAGFRNNNPPFTYAGVNVPTVVPPGEAIVTGQSVIDSTRLTYDNYEIRFDPVVPNQFDIVNTSTGATVQTAQPYTSGQAIQFEGISITLTDNPGAPSPGAAYQVQTQRPGLYLGDSNVQEIEIQQNTFLAQNIPGDRVFQGAGMAGGIDIFSVMGQINDALVANDQVAMSALLDNLDTSQGQISGERSRIGAQANLLNDIKERQTNILDSLDILRSNLEDVDVAEALTELNKQQNTYDATLGAATKIVQNSLLDFLR